MSYLNKYLYTLIVLLLTVSISSAVFAQKKNTKHHLTKNEELKIQATKSSDPWTVNHVYTTEELAKILSSKKSNKPILLQVGFRFLYNQSHIPGSKFVGPASRKEGIETLKNEVKKYNHNKNIVLYCGCCPWTDCPNIRAAYKTAKDLGYKNVHVLYIPDTFVKDWADKGHPATKWNNN